MTVGLDRPEMAGRGGVAHPKTGMNGVCARCNNASLRTMRAIIAGGFKRFQPGLFMNAVVSRSRPKPAGASHT